MLLGDYGNGKNTQQVIACVHGAELGCSLCTTFLTAGVQCLAMPSDMVAEIGKCLNWPGAHGDRDVVAQQLQVYGMAALQMRHGKSLLPFTKRLFCNNHAV